jgi:hypothetical protein
MSCVILWLLISHVSFLGLGVCVLDVYYPVRWYSMDNIELPDDGPYVTKTFSIINIHFCCVDSLIIFYICNTQQDAHYEDY